MRKSTATALTLLTTLTTLAAAPALAAPGNMNDYFKGSIHDLSELRKRVNVPLLRKDFLFDDYQLLEAAVAGPRARDRHDRACR